MSYMTRCAKLCVSTFLQLGNVSFPRKIVLRVNQARLPGIESGVLRVNHLSDLMVQ